MSASGPWVKTSPRTTNAIGALMLRRSRRAERRLHSERARGDDGEDASVEPVFHVPDLAARVGAPPG